MFINTDIDECKESSTCQHNCTNLQGSFECACATGYTLENDGISCKGNIHLYINIQINQNIDIFH